MTPKEKAEQLYCDCIASIDYDSYQEDGLMFAIVICNEVIDALSINYWQNKEEVEYWSEVRRELKKI